MEKEEIDIKLIKYLQKKRKHNYRHILYVPVLPNGDVPHAK